ncbi:DnaJ domain-containing protein [Tanacetum coccineum]
MSRNNAWPISTTCWRRDVQDPGSATASPEEKESTSFFFNQITSRLQRKAEATPAFQSSGNSANSFSPSAEDPFVIYLIIHVHGTSKANYYGASGVDVYLDLMFSAGTRSNTRPSQSSTSEDSVYDALFNNNVAPKEKDSFESSHNSKKASFESSHNTKKASSKPKNTNDFDYLFGMGGNSILRHCQLLIIILVFVSFVCKRRSSIRRISGNQGESAERRQAKYNQRLATRECMVLWAGSGWQPISSTDLITSTAIKKAYYKACRLLQSNMTTAVVAAAKRHAEASRIREKYPDRIPIPSHTIQETGSNGICDEAKAQGLMSPCHRAALMPCLRF